jgi:hypothetical protein
MSENSETTETMPAVAETIETAASKIEKLKGDLKDQADKAIGKAKETATAA